METLTQRAASLLRINKGEGSTAWLMFSYFFLVLAMYMIGKAARDAVFIGTFGALKLPYAVVAQAIFLSLLVALYIKFSNRLSHYCLSVLTLLAFAASSLALWAAHWQQSQALVFTFYVWVGIVGAIAPMQVWTMANLIYNAREAKRLFGFIGSGGILGSIFGGYLTRKLAPAIGTENLVPIIAACLMLSALVVHLLWRRNRERAAQVRQRSELSNLDAAGAPAESAANSAASSAPRSMWGSAALIGRSRYLRLIAALVAISAMATTVAYVQFSVIAKMHFTQTDDLTSFFGGMYEGLSWAAFVLQFLLTGRVLNRWGLGLTIFILPLSLLTGSVVALLYPTLWAAVLLRASDQVFRHSIDRSTTEMLYLPVAPEIKIQVKTFIDTVVWRVGDAFAALLLMWLSGLMPQMSQSSVSVINIALVLPWLAIAYFAGRGYVSNLRDSLKRQDLPQGDFTSALLNLSAAVRNTGRLQRVTGPLRKITGRLHRQRSVNELLDMLEEEQTRCEAVQELHRLRLKLGSLEFAEEKIEKILLAEIRAYRKRARALGQPAVAPDARKSLERVFNLLGLLYPPADIFYAYHAITSGSLHLKANAVEYLDNVLEPDIKRRLIPAIEGSLAYSAQLN
jgi:ATP:ADP antiporter, AAA family